MVDAPPKPKTKIPVHRIPADDCVISVGREVEDGEIIKPGVEYPIHEGEWVEVLPTRSLREMTSLNKLQAAIGDPGEDVSNRDLTAMNTAMIELCQELSKRIINWNWTDMLGDPLPAPYRDAEVFMALTSEELFWLVGAVEGEPADDRKNGSGGWETTS